MGPAELMQLVDAAPNVALRSGWESGVAVLARLSWRDCRARGIEVLYVTARRLGVGRDCCVDWRPAAASFRGSRSNASTARNS